MDEDRLFPAKCLVKKCVFRCGGDELSAAHDVRDVHQMVVDDIGKVVGRHAVALQENLIFEFLVLYGDDTVEDVVKGRLTIERHFLADDVGIIVF